MSRHDVTAKEWELIKDLANYKPKRGASPKHVRRYLDGICWLLATGASWRDIPDRYGPWESIYIRWRVYIRLGVLPKIIERLHRDAAEKGHMMLSLTCVDGTYVRAHRHAARARKKNGQSADESALEQALGRSRGGFTTKLHLICDGLGRPLVVLLTPGNMHDSVVFEALFFGLLSYMARLKLRKRLRFVSGDKGYDAERIFQAIRDAHLTPVIARRRGPKGEDRTDPDFSRKLYRQRNQVERCIGRLKESRRVATRYEKLAITYASMVQLAMISDLAKAC